MANSKYEYVRHFEQPDNLLANTWIVVRIDGRGFSKLTARYKFVKPNDRNALDLMNAAAEAVMKELPDLVLAYGNSDEYSFVFHKDCVLFERRASKLSTTIASTFTSYYVHLWSNYFPEKPLTPPLPSFDGRAVCYPSDSNLRDYMSWRQVDCHINNLYNTTFWNLVQQGGMGAREAEQRLSGTVSSDKNEILFKEFGINYNNEPECFKKGTVLYRDFFPVVVDQSNSAAQQSKTLTVSSPTKHGSTQRSSLAINQAISAPQDQEVSPLSTNPGPTFLSASSTPSPPPTPLETSKATLPNPLRSNPVSPRSSSFPSITMPLSPPSSVTSPMGSVYVTSGTGKHFHPSLTPLPLSPPTLRPSTRPPHSLDAPNPTTRSNFSPMSPPSDFPTAFQVYGYSHNVADSSNKTTSHSASASMTLADTSQAYQPKLKQRSPSQPHLPSYFTVGNVQEPPVIPLRISSIPTNNKPRKLSLQNHRSLSNLKPSQAFEEKDNILSPIQTAGSATPRRLSPPLRTNKALPSPPMNSQEEEQTRERVMSNSPKDMADQSVGRDSPSRRISESQKREGYVWPDTGSSVNHPGIAELPAGPARHTSNHSRLHSAPTFATLQYPHQSPDVQTLTVSNLPKSQPYPTSQPFPSSVDIQPTPPLKDSLRSKVKRASEIPGGSGSSHEEVRGSNKGKNKATEADGWAAGTQGRPGPMSRNQRDKDRKKRSKARIVTEHVDIIKDEFWEKRPWILSGKTE